MKMRESVVVEGILGGASVTKSEKACLAFGPLTQREL